MPKKINILFVHQSADLYGSDKMLFALATGLDPEKFNPIVILPCDGPLYAALKKKVRFVYISPLVRMGRSLISLRYLASLPFRIFKTSRRLDKILAGQSIDIVHTNTLAVWTGAFWARRNRINHIWNVRELLVGPKWVNKLIAHLIDHYSLKVIGNSNETIKSLVEYNKHLLNKVSYIYNGVAPDHIIQNSAIIRGNLDIPSDAIVISLVGRINRMKGQKVLIQAGEILAKRISEINIIYLFVGSPPQNQDKFLIELDRFINTSKIKNSIKRLDYCEKISSIWKITDICVVPSTEPESFGLVAVEAMRAGKPVIASDHGGIKEIIEHNITGLRCTPGDPKALADSLELLIRSKELRYSMGRAGFERYKEKFTQAQFISKFQNEYYQLMKKSTIEN